MIKIKILVMLVFFVFSAQAQIKKGTKMPLSDLQLTDVKTDTKKAILDYKLEKGLLVIFSCNTCPFVVGTPDFPGWERQYNDLYEKAKQNGIGMVLINSNEGKRSKDDSYTEMKNHAEDKGYKMPYLLDENSKLANEFEAKTTPHVYLFDGETKLVYSGSIDNIWDNKRTEETPYLVNAMNALNQGKKIKPSETPPRGCSIKRILKS
jgi:thioredoxin-related protein